MKSLIITIALALLIGCNTVKTESRSSVTISCTYVKWDGDYQYINLYVLDDGIEIVSMEQFAGAVQEAANIQTPSPVMKYTVNVSTGSTVQIRYKYGNEIGWSQKILCVENDTIVECR